MLHSEKVSLELFYMIKIFILIPDGIVLHEVIPDGIVNLVGMVSLLAGQRDTVVAVGNSGMGFSQADGIKAPGLVGGITAIFY